MIEPQSLQIALQSLGQIAEQLDRQSLSIVPQDGTPLAELARTTRVIEPQLDAVAEAQYIEDVSAASDNNAHNERFDYYVKEISTAVGLHLSFVRNHVVAAVQAISEGVQRELAKVEADVSKQFAVVQFTAPAPMTEDLLLESIAKEGKKNFLLPERYFAFPESAIVPDELTQSMLTGSRAVDEKILIWASSLPKDFLRSIWVNLFCSVQGGAAPLNTISFDSINQPGQYDAALAVYLLTRHIEDNVLENSGLDKTDYIRLCGQYRDAACSVLAGYQTLVERSIKTNRLVVAYDRANKRVTVVPNIYRDYIKTGGTNEAILGALVSNGSELFVHEFIEKKDQYVRAWSQFVTISQTKFRNSYHAHFSDAMSLCFFSELKNAAALEQEFAAENPNYLDKVKELYQQQMARVDNNDLEDIPRTVARVVTKSRYYYTDAYKILKTIDTVSKANSRISPKEAARMATIEYIADFMIAQMRLA